MSVSASSRLHSFLEMTIVDGKTMEVIDDSPVIMPPGSNVTAGALMSRNDPFPEKGLNGFQWHNHWSAMTPGQQQQIRSEIATMLTEAVGYTVQKSFSQQ